MRIVSGLGLGVVCLICFWVYTLGCVFVLIAVVWYLVALRYDFVGLVRGLVVCVLLGWFG